MHYKQAEKMEIIRLVEQSDLGVIRTLNQLKVNKTTFYKWYNAFLQAGYSSGSQIAQLNSTFNTLRDFDIYYIGLGIGLYDRIFYKDEMRYGK